MENIADIIRTKKMDISKKQFERTDKRSAENQAENPVTIISMKEP